MMEAFPAMNIDTGSPTLAWTSWLFSFRLNVFVDEVAELIGDTVASADEVAGALVVRIDGNAVGGMKEPTRSVL